MKAANFSQVFSVFTRNYKLVPLEVFGQDPYKTLISTMLSARTRDDITLPISQRLFEIAPTIYKLDAMSEEEIAKAIHGVNFYRNKAKYLTRLAEMVVQVFKGKVPETREGLVSLPGIGRKTANIVLNRAYGRPAIAVDTHVHRISNLLGWVHTHTPKDTELELMRILPKKYWKDINRLFVSIGQQYRSPKKLREFLQKNNLLSL